MSKDTKRRAGRPPLSDNEKTYPRSIRLTKAHWAKLQRLGSAWLRRVIDAAEAPTETIRRPDANETILLVADLHGDQVDKLGAPYYFHPMRVMMRLGPGAPEPEKLAALLHDVLEDVPGITAETLREKGYSDDVIAMLRLLARKEGESYPAFIDRIIASGNLGAMRIKLADLYDNTNEERMKDAPAEVRTTLEAMAESRYKPAISKLKLAIGPAAGAVISGGL